MENERKNIPSIGEIEEALAEERRKLSFISGIRKTIISLLVVSALTVLITMLFFPVVQISGTSMENTLLDQEYVFTNKNSECGRGDIVAISLNNETIVKRIIGVGGDVIDMDQSGTVYVNGTALDESYIYEKSIGTCDVSFPYTVPSGGVFVMGDHRSVSVDSRSFGYVNYGQIKGKVVLCFWPLSSFHIIK